MRTGSNGTSILEGRKRGDGAPGGLKSGAGAELAHCIGVMAQRPIVRRKTVGDGRSRLGCSPFLAAAGPILLHPVRYLEPLALLHGLAAAPLGW